VRQDEFSLGNRTVAERAVADQDSGLRVVINLGTFALLKLVPAGRYLNLYERPVIGGSRKSASPERIFVDNTLGLQGEDVYFAAVALGGVGVRYYGEYCLVIRLDNVDPNPRLFDRDSYDILLEPIKSYPERRFLIQQLRGHWVQDRFAMVLLKVLPELEHQQRLVTTGTVSETVLKDQEFIEVHLHPHRSDGGSGGFGPRDIEEVRESPDEVALATRLRQREEDEALLSPLEYEWLTRREAAGRVIGKAGLRYRVVAQHGRGYQWK